MTVIDIDAQVFSWFQNQINASASADEDYWIASFPSIAPIQGQSVAGFMLILWGRNPLLGQPHLTTGSFITGVPTEEAVKEAARGMVAKLADDRSALLNQSAPNGQKPMGLINLNDRRWRKN